MSQIQRFFTVLFFAATLLIAGCSKSSTDAGLEKEDLDGDGIADIYDPDIDGDGIPNGSDPDIDGDGIPNDKDNDMDGDGKPNGKDPDPENNDPNYCDQIQVFGLNEEDSTGSIIAISWQLQSSKTGGFCVVKDDVKVGLVRVRASAAGAKSTTSEQTNPVINTRTTIRIPAACTGETVEVTYDFTEIATLIKADPNAPGWTVKQRHRADPERCDTDGDGLPDFGPAQCPTGATGTYPNCSCPADQGYDVSSNACLDIGEGIGDLECTNVDINWPGKSVKLGESATITWSFIPGGCQLADEDARLTLTVKHNTDPNVPTESVSASAIERSASLTLPCFTNTSQTLKYEMTGIDEAFGYETDLPLVKTGSHDPATSCPSEPPEPAPDEISCGVSNLEPWGSGDLAQAFGGCSELNKTIFTRKEAECLCAAKQLPNGTFWTSTYAYDTSYYIIRGSDCKVNNVDWTTPKLNAMCVSD